MRALLLYAAVERIRERKGVERNATIEFPLPKLIELTAKIFPTHGLFEKLGAPNKMYEKIKRGRKVWGIDEFWRGKPLAELIDEMASVSPF